ncbi:MAG: hydroxymethylbilane synthase, partial [Acidithiobacillus ferrivorans]
WQGPQMLLRGLVATPDGRRVLHAEARGSDPVALGMTVAAALVAQGAAQIIADVRNT